MPPLIALRKTVFRGFWTVLTILVFVLIFVPRESLIAGLANTTWPKWGNNARNTARQGGAFTQSGGFGLAWSFNAASYDPGVTFQGSPVQGNDGIIYIGGHTPIAPVYALNPSGTLKWRTILGDGSKSGIATTPVIDSEGLVVATRYGLFKLNISNGAILWSLPGVATSQASPAVATDGTIYIYSVDVSTGGALFWAINPNGTTKWSKDLPGSSDGITPAIASDGTVYFTTSDRTLWALNPDGTPKWTYTTNDSAIASPMVGIDNTIYVADTLTAYAVNPDGTLKWQYVIDGDYIGAGLAEAVDGTVYFGTAGPPHYLYALNPNGTLKWRYATASGIDGGVSIDGQGVIYAPANVSIYAVNRDGGLHWRYDKPSGSNFSFFSTPIISTDSNLLITSAISDGTMTALAPAGIAAAIPSAILSKPPTVTIESPKSGDLVPGDIVLLYTATDPEGTGESLGFGDNPIWIDYSLNQGITGTWKPYVVQGKNEGKIVFEKRLFADETEVFLRVVAKDRSGLLDEAVVGPIIVDTTPPAFLIGVGTPKDPGFITLSVTSTENLKGAPDIYVDQAGRGKVLAVTYGEGRSYVSRYEVVQHFDGIAKVYVSGVDLAGNIGDAILSGGRFSVFVTPPEKPTVRAPKDGDVVEESVVALSGTSVPTAKVILTVNGVDIYTAKPDAEGLFTIPSVRLSAANRGVNTLSLVAEDAVGVSEPTVLTLTLNTLPRVFITAPLSQRVLSETVRVSWSAQDENTDKLTFSFAYSLDDKQSWITTATGIVGASYGWDTTLVPDGPGANIRITASDGIGVSHAIAGPFTIRNYLPVTEVLSPASRFVSSNLLSLEGRATSEHYTVRGLAYRLDEGGWTAIPPKDGAYDSAEELFALTLPRQFPDGEVMVQFRAEDQRQKFGYQSARYTIDTVPPQNAVLRSFDAPPIYGDADDVDETQAGIQIHLFGVAEPSATALVISKDGELGRGSVGQDGTFVVPVTIPAHGENRLAVFVEDRATNRSGETLFTFIANNASRIELTWPKGGDVIGAIRTLSWRASDTDGDKVASFSLSVRRKRSITWEPVAENLTAQAFTWDSVMALASGEYELRLSGSDGFERSETIASIRVDTVLPSLGLATVIPRRTANPRIAGEGTVQDDFAGIEVVEFALDDGPFTKAVITKGYRTTDAAYRFAFPRALEDGTYALRLRTTDRAENVSAITESIFAIDTTPPVLGTWRLLLGPTQLFPEEGILRVFTGTPYRFSLATSPDAAEVLFKVGDEFITLSRSPGSQVANGSIAPTKPGLYPMRVEASDDVGNAKAAEVGVLHAIEPARVVEKETDVPLSGADVSAQFFDADAQIWRLWDGKAYGQENPQRTLTDGSFRFTLPPGTYEISVRKTSYKRTKTSPLTLEKPTMLTLSIPLERTGFWEELLQRLRIID